MGRCVPLATCVLGALLNAVPAAADSRAASRPTSQAVGGAQTVGGAQPASGTRKHSEHISAAAAEFAVTIDGTADQRRMGGWKEDGKADHNPTCSLRIANQGDRPVVNPRVVVAGGPDWFDTDHIVSEFARPGMSDQEKTFALWQWVRHNMRGGPTFDGSLWGDGQSMSRFMNALGTGACGTYHQVMPVIGKQAGLDTYSGCFADCSHAVQKEVYDGQDRYCDAHIEHQPGQPQGWFALKLDNTQIAGIKDIMEDRYLIDRAGGGPGRFGYVAYFGPGCSFSRVDDRRDPRDMSITLRPGETITWHWDLTAPAWKPGNETKDTALHCSGCVEYLPRLTRDDVVRYAELARKVRFEALADATPVVGAEADGAELVYRLYCPYPITRATIAGQLAGAGGDGAISISYSLDGQKYEPLKPADSQVSGTRAFELTLPDGPRLHEPTLTHEVWFRLAFRDDRTRLCGLKLRVDFQAYRPSLPSLYAGRNTVRFTADASGPAENLPLAIVEASRLGLVNGGFEEGSDQQQAPAGWTVFGRTDGRHIGEWFGKTRPAEGHALFGAGADWDVKDGGIYQKLRWPGGRRANAAAYIITKGDTTNSSGCRIGLDPNGGTDPTSPDIVWSGLARGDGWKRIETGPVTIPTGSREITVFLHHKHANDGNHFNITGFDACTIQDQDRKREDHASEPSRDSVLVEYEYRDLPNLPVPKPPAGPVHPPDGGRFGFNEMVRWTPAAIDGNGRIDNYEIYISPRKDLAWPVMPNTHRITGSGELVFKLVFPDVLRHGATYYWRVRGRSAEGLWGDWSPTWSFVAAGPNAPRDLAARYDAETAKTTLSWQPPQGGTDIDHYEVYASGEPGFSPLREPETTELSGKVINRPANLLATTRETGLDVSDRTEVFYRITAVDADGNRGGPTPIVKLASPALLPTKLPPAVVGKAYSARLPTRLRTGRYALSLRQGVIIDQADQPTFKLAAPSAADWLTIDAKTGELRGTPPAAGTPATAAAGTRTITVQLDDGHAGQCSRRYELRIEGLR